MIIFLTEDPAIATMAPGDTVLLIGPSSPSPWWPGEYFIALDRGPKDSRVLLKCHKNVDAGKRIMDEIQRRIRAHGDSPNNLVIDMAEVVKQVLG
jgi:hypothetical protein